METWPGKYVPVLLLFLSQPYKRLFFRYIKGRQIMFTKDSRIYIKNASRRHAGG